MGGRSLGWGVREKGRRTSGEMKIGSRLEEKMSFLFFVLPEGFVYNWI